MAQSDPIQWGVLGTGSIAHQFLRSMQEVPDGRVVACASETAGKAEHFAKDWGIPHAHTGYEHLLKMPEVRAVYVANTHNFHADTVRQALLAGKAVLCEKPMATSAEEVRMLAELAREQRQFLMEGMWTRFLPAVRKARKWVREGALGSLKFLRADFAFSAPVDPSSRLFDPGLAGGALLDVGIYPLSVARFLMGEEPEEIHSVVEYGETGVDEQTAWICRYASGAIGSMSCAIRSVSENRLECVGSNGRLVLPGPFFKAEKAILYPEAGEPEVFEEAFPEGAGFLFEINAVHEALNQGELEHPLMPVSESVEIAETLDRIRDKGMTQAS